MADLLGSAHAHRFRGMSASIAGGASLAVSGSRFGLFTARDRGLMRLAEHSGSMARATDLLAAAYDQRAIVFGKLRSRMVLPLFVFALALFLLPLPSLLGGRIGAEEFLWRTLGPIALLAILGGTGSRLVRRISAQGVSRATGRLGLRIPFLATALGHAHRLQLVEGLSLLLRAGVPIKDALEAALDAVTNPAARSNYASALPRLEQLGLSRALRSAGVLDAEAFAIASISEQAGRLEDGLEQIAAKLRKGLEERLDLVSEWLPRGAYLVVVAFIVAGLIG
jgi:type II secretory pathway component PulF